MIFTDWRDVEAEELAPLYGAESRRWTDALGWDLAPSWSIVENARRVGHVPGLLARSADGRVAGWTFYILHEGILQLGTLVGQRASVLRALLDRAMQSNEARLARAFSAFLFPASASLPAALARQHFAIADHPYMVRAIAGGAEPPEGGAASATPHEDDESAAPSGFRVRPLAEVDAADVVRLMARAYAGLAEARCFAPDLRLEQWAHYVGQLLSTPAVGRCLPAASFAVERRDSAHLQAAVITTSLSPGTAHIAQIVVDPAGRRAGLARLLLETACAQAARAGHSRMSLIVSGTNDPARSLYDRMGFRESARFLYATRPALMRQATLTRISRPAAAGTSAL